MRPQRALTACTGVLYCSQTYAIAKAQHMKRREFIAALGSTTLWPLVSRAQPTGKVYRIGILETVSAAQNAANIDALRNGLQKLGYVEGQNLIVEYRSAE